MLLPDNLQINEPLFVDEQVVFVCENEPNHPESIAPFQSQTPENVFMVKPDQATLADADALFIQKIIGACDNDAAKTLCLVWQPGLSIATINRLYSPARLVMVGLRPDEVNLHMQMPLNSVVKLNKQQLIFAASIQAMNANAQLKNDLWHNALKLTFNK